MEDMENLVVGSHVSILLNELILTCKRAYRSKQDCENLVVTLESLQPLLTIVIDSSNLENTPCQAWLTDLYTLLVQAKGIVKNCDVEQFKHGSKYVKKRQLSSQIQTLNRLIQGITSAGLEICNAIQALECKVDSLSATSYAVDQPSIFEMQQVPSFIVAFENNPFEKLKELILSTPSNVINVIGLRGEVGTGKTLLAQMVSNDEDIQKKYEARSILWIFVGTDVSMSSIYKKMGKFLNDPVFERSIISRDLKEQRTYLIKAFKQKQVLVILDDIWGNCVMDHTVIYWLNICKGDGSTTLITTRDNDVLDNVRAIERIEVGSLSIEGSWKLFSFHAFQANMPPSSEVKAIAMEICNECKGLPLALKVIGYLMWEEKDVKRWKYVLSSLKRSESWMNLTTVEDRLFRHLKYSYDALEDETKKCFLYFAAFPKDYCVSTSQLYSIWEAENMFGLCDVEGTLHMGRMHLITLANRALIDLDDIEKYAKMHDVVRDFAIRIIRDAEIGEWAYECQFEPGKALKTLPKIKETTKRVSFIGTHVANLDSQLCSTSHDLQICLLSSLRFDHKSGCPISLPKHFFSNMEHLSYLNLQCDSLKELPESIKELKCLTHLDLSGCDSLEELPECIKALKFLTNLNLNKCESLKELPESIKGLKFLTNLDLSSCSSLHKLPKSMAELKYLAHLNLSGCKSLKEFPKNIKAFKSCTYIGPAVSVEDPINESEEYLKLTKVCMEQAMNITSSIRSFSLRFNDQQCKYLADKLKSVVKSVDLFLCREEKAYCLKIFKLLYASAKEVVDFIQSHCVEDAWIQAAMLLSNVSDYVAATAFNLELCRLVCSPRGILGVRRSITLTGVDVDAIFKAEVGNVREKALFDREALSKKLKEVEENKNETNVEFQFAALLLERLEGAKPSVNTNMFHKKMAQLEEAVLPRFRIKKKLGKGSAATVFKATLLGGEVALKTFEGLHNVDFDKEVSVLRGLSHSNIISLLCSGSYRHGKCSIVVELMDGDLAWLINERIREKDDKSEPPFDIMEAIDVMLQVGRGMAYLHGMKIVHRDLKSMNILVRRVKKHNGIEYVVAKVADFGLSKTKESTKTYSNQTLNQGTLSWMAPEMMEHCGKDKVLNYPFKTDIYSFGMVCFEILSGDTPFSEVQLPRMIRKLVLEGERPTLPNQCPPVLKCLIERCWSKDPTKRPEFGEICAELRHLKYLLLMQAGLKEVEPAQSVSITEPVASASNTCTIVEIPQLSPCTKAVALEDAWHGPPILPPLITCLPPGAIPHAQFQGQSSLDLSLFLSAASACSSVFLSTVSACSSACSTACSPPRRPLRQAEGEGREGEVPDSEGSEGEGSEGSEGEGSEDSEGEGSEGEDSEGEGS